MKNFASWSLSETVIGTMKPQSDLQISLALSTISRPASLNAYFILLIYGSLKDIHQLRQYCVELQEEQVAVFRYRDFKTSRTYVEIKCQLDATEVFIADLTACSTCFGHYYAHHQELKSIIQCCL